MSKWIHVNSSIRVDVVSEPFDDIVSKIQEKIIKNGLPKGSEGTLSYFVSNQKNEVQLIVFGNLRDRDINYANQIIKKIINYTSDLSVRQGFIQIDCEDESICFIKNINNKWTEFKRMEGNNE